jgi:hypothetical protein
MYDGSFGTDYVWHLKPEFKFPLMPISVCIRLCKIDRYSIKTSFKIEWVTAIASIFEESNIYAKKSLESKKTDAKIKLNAALTFADEKEIGPGGIDAKFITDEVLEEFEKYLNTHK